MKTKSIITLVTVLTLTGTTSFILLNKDEENSNKTEPKISKSINMKMELTNTFDKNNVNITGLKNQSVFLNEKINILEGVNATDCDGNTIPISVSDFSTDTIGEQTITLTAVGKDNHKSVKKIILNVKEPQDEEYLGKLETEIPKETVTDTQPITTQFNSNKTDEKSKEPATKNPQNQQPIWSEDTMYVGGMMIPYQNAGETNGQAVIDSNSNMIATWGGSAVQSGTDNLNTHFIGHNPGIFSILFSLNYGEEIIVTDNNGVPTSYHINNIFRCDDYGTNIDTKVNQMDDIIGTGGGERITLQTCVNDDINLIIMASAN